MRKSLIGISSLTLLGCTVLSPGDVRELGILAFGEGDTLVVTLPDTVRVGTPFNVRFHTRGPSGCYYAGETDLDLFGRKAVLRPYDYHPADAVCPGVVLDLEHTAVVRFDSPGAGVIEIQGRRLGDGGGEARVTREVVVE